MIKDWNSEAPPETDMEGFYNTSLPVFLFKMIDQNVSRFFLFIQEMLFDKFLLENSKQRLMRFVVLTNHILKDDVFLTVTQAYSD